MYCHIAVSQGTNESIAASQSVLLCRQPAVLHPSAASQMQTQLFLFREDVPHEMHGCEPARRGCDLFLGSGVTKAACTVAVLLSTSADGLEFDC